MDNLFWRAAWEGTLLGAGLAFLIGPAFFALLQASIDHGFRVSVALAVGVVSSDVLLILISYRMLEQIPDLPFFHEGLALTGGVVLIASGLMSIFGKHNPPEKLPFSFRDFWTLFRKGFAINTFNPFPWMFWLSTSDMVRRRFGETDIRAAFLFFGLAAVTVLGTDTLKAWLAKFLVRYLNTGVLQRFRTISGLCLIGFGLRLLWFAWSQTLGR